MLSDDQDVCRAETEKVDHSGSPEFTGSDLLASQVEQPLEFGQHFTPPSAQNNVTHRGRGRGRPRVVVERSTFRPGSTSTPGGEAETYVEVLRQLNATMASSRESPVKAGMFAGDDKTSINTFLRHFGLGDHSNSPLNWLL